jgi:uncharacterized protein YidB (DUF937 family)
MFDALIRELSQRFGLGDKAQGLITLLLGLVFDPDNGGVPGLLTRFKQQGLGDLFSSWLGGAPGQPAVINPQQIENVLGASQLSGIADKLGIARGTVVAAASAALPKIIGAVTVDSQLPAGIPASISGMLGGLGSGLGGLDAAGTASATRSAASNTASTASSTINDSGGGLGWLKWLILAAIILALGYCMMIRQPAPTTPPPAITQTPTPNGAYLRCEPS